METQDIQNQINELNTKMDLILERVNQQCQRSSAMEDLVADLSIVGKDAYDSTVEELENQQIEIDPEELRILGVKLLRNVKNISAMVSMFESMMDLAEDAGPIINENIIDLSKKLNEFDQKGYFEFFRELGNIIDRVITHTGTEQLKQMGDNILLVLDTINQENIPEYSLWKTMGELRKPEMKKTMGLLITLLKKLNNKNK